MLVCLFVQKELSIDAEYRYHKLPFEGPDVLVDERPIDQDPL